MYPDGQSTGPTAISSFPGEAGTLTGNPDNMTLICSLFDWEESV